MKKLISTKKYFPISCMQHKAMSTVQISICEKLINKEFTVPLAYAKQCTMWEYFRA